MNAAPPSSSSWVGDLAPCTFWYESIRRANSSPFIAWAVVAIRRPAANAKYLVMRRPFFWMGRSGASIRERWPARYCCRRPSIRTVVCEIFVSRYSRACHPRNRGVDPSGNRVGEQREDVGVLAAAPRRHVERMVRVVEQHDVREITEALDDGHQQRKAGEIVARALQEQHRDAHAGKMRGSFVRRLAGRMQRKAEED